MLLLLSNFPAHLTQTADHAPWRSAVRVGGEGLTAELSGECYCYEAATIDGRVGEISYGAQNGCICARPESNLVSFGTVAATALQMADVLLHKGMSQQAGMVPLRHCHHGNIYLLCSDHFFGVEIFESCVRPRP